MYVNDHRKKETRDREIEIERPQAVAVAVNRSRTRDPVHTSNKARNNSLPCQNKARKRGNKDDSVAVVVTVAVTVAVTVKRPNHNDNASVRETVKRTTTNRTTTNTVSKQSSKHMKHPLLLRLVVVVVGGCLLKPATLYISHLYIVKQHRGRREGPTNQR